MTEDSRFSQDFICKKVVEWEKEGQEKNLTSNKFICWLIS